MLTHKILSFHKSATKGVVILKYVRGVGVIQIWEGGVVFFTSKGRLDLFYLEGRHTFFPAIF